MNLKGVTSIAEHGKALLQRIYQQHGTLTIPGCWTKAIVEEVTVVDLPPKLVQLLCDFSGLVSLAREGPRRQIAERRVRLTPAPLCR